VEEWSQAAITAHNQQGTDSTWDEDYSSDSDDIDETEFDETSLTRQISILTRKSLKNYNLMNFGLSRETEKEISLGWHCLACPVLSL
jgi:hypothetical protein